LNMSVDTPHLLTIGAASIDTKGRAAKAIQLGTSTPGAIRVSVGGVGLGVEVDGIGHRHDGIEPRAVGHVLVDPEHRTAAYLAVLDETGHMAMSIDDMQISPDLLTPGFIYRHRALFRDAQMLVLDANLTPATLRTIFRLARRYQVPVCADPTSATLAPRLCPHLAELLLVTPDAAEAEALCGVEVLDRESALGAAQKLVGLGVQIAIVTLGATGLVYATSQESGHVPALARDIVELTGAGDALTAAVIFGLLNDLAIGEAVRLGASAAALTLQSRETVSPELSLERLYDQLV